MTAVQERILLNLSMNPYLDWSYHRDLINITVPAEQFLDIEECEQEDFDPGFTEVIAIVEKDYLFGIMEKEGVADPRKYLEDEYSSDDAIRWFDDCSIARKVAVVAFK